jgi:hypothetical protein
MNTEQAPPEVAEAELAAVLSELGLQLDWIDGEDARLGGVAIAVKSAARPTIDVLAKWVSRATVPGVVVADRLGPAQRDLLEQAGWGWLDRSGHLRIQAGTVFVERPIPSLRGPVPTLSDPLTRPSGLAIALASLADPHAELTVREIAVAAQVSVGSASETASELQQIGLLDRARRPAVPELFWEVAAKWRVRWFPLARWPRAELEAGVERLLQFGFGTSGPGWAEVGAIAAQSYGVPVVASGEPPRLYVPTQRALTWAIRTWGEAHEVSEGAVRVAVPPTGFAVRNRQERPHANSLDGWPLASPLVVAVTMAADRDPRAREVLQGWNPSVEVGQPRVW